jgi:hypothetical protein
MSLDLDQENSHLLHLESISNRSSKSFLSDNTSETDTETTVNRGILSLKKRKKPNAKLQSNTMEDIDSLQELNMARLKLRWKKFDFEMAIRNVKDSGTYQKSIMIVSIVCLFGCSFTSYLLGFISPDPVTEC